MDLITPSEIESRARAVGLTMAAVCRKAGIAPSTFNRWKKGDTSPTLKVCQLLIEAISSEKGELS